MTYEEIEAEKDKLTQAKKGYETNRTLCAGVIAFLVYTTFKNGEFSSTPWYILLIMALLTICALFLLVRDSIIISKLNSDLKNLDSGISPDSEEDKNDK